MRQPVVWSTWHVDAQHAPGSPTWARPEGEWHTACVVCDCVCEREMRATHGQGETPVRPRVLAREQSALVGWEFACTVLEMRDGRSKHTRLLRIMRRSDLCE